MAYDVNRSERFAGGRLELSLTDRSGRIQNLYAVYADIVAAMQAAAIECAQKTQEAAYDFCPVDTGFMRDHIMVEASEQFQTFEIGWRASDFFAEGLDFYPMYVVLGTRHMAPRDPLTPAYAQTKPLYEERTAELVRQAIERRRVA